MKNNYYKLKGCLLFILSALCFAAQASNEVQSVRVWPSPDNTRVVFDLTAAPEHKYFTLDKPDRLVIDLRNIKNGSSLPAVSGDTGLIKTIRSSSDNNSMRIVLDLDKASKATVFALPPTPPYGHRLVVDLPDSQPQQSAPAITPTIRTARDIVIAIDADL
ncbi:MAG: AMIN domain-containing protein, partial [Gammaproteobacteria bacterium]|nr:AMIN domain-containing protein [Gammaproteobacteria bacterium]